MFSQFYRERPLSPFKGTAIWKILLSKSFYYHQWIHLLGIKNQELEKNLELKGKNWRRAPFSFNRICFNDMVYLVDLVYGQVGFNVCVQCGILMRLKLIYLHLTIKGKTKLSCCQIQYWIHTCGLLINKQKAEMQCRYTVLYNYSFTHWRWNIQNTVNQFRLCNESFV